MPLSNMQRNVMSVLLPFRSEQSYVGGGAALNLRWPRLSDDMDIFRDARTDPQSSVEPELRALRDRGFNIETVVDAPETVEAIIRKNGEETRVQWFADPDSCFRFYPVIADDQLGFRLHQADNAVNKVLCAARRYGAARDAVDLVFIVRNYAPLGSLIWAATGKATAINNAISSTAPEENPTQLIRNIRANVFGYADEQIRAVSLTGESSLTRVDVRQILEPALDDAESYCDDTAPLDLLGHLFVDNNEQPVAADTHAIEQETARAVPIQNFTPAVTIS